MALSFSLSLSFARYKYTYNYTFDDLTSNRDDDGAVCSLEVSGFPARVEAPSPLLIRIKFIALALLAGVAVQAGAVVAVVG